MANKYVIIEPSQQNLEFEMAANVTPIRSRIESGRIFAEDIKHQNRLTEDEIANIDVKLVYEWVRTGQWKAKDFQYWLRVMRVI